MAALILAALYVVGALSLYAFFRTFRGYTTITVADTTLPWQWHQIRLKQGQELIARARADLARGDGRAAFFKLRVGVQRFPYDGEARLELAAFYAANGQPALSAALVSEGLRQVPLSEAGFFLPALRHIAATGGERQVIDITAELLAGAVPSRDSELALCIPRVESLIAVRRAAEALEVLEGHRMERAQLPEIEELWAVALWEAERRGEAVERLSLAIERHPGSDALVRRQASYLLGLGRGAEAEALQLSRWLASTGDFRRRLQILDDVRRMGSRGLTEQLEDRFLRDYAGEYGALLAGIERVTSSGSPESMERYVAALPADLRFDTDVQINRAVVLLRAGRAADARTIVDRLAPAAESSKRRASSLRLLQLVCLQAEGDREGVERVGRAVLGDTALQAPALTATAALLGVYGAEGWRAELLREAWRREPWRQDVLLEVFADDLRRGELRLELLEDVIRRGAWTPALLQHVSRRLTSDFYVFNPNRDAYRELVERSRSGLPEVRDGAEEFIRWKPDARLLGARL